MIKHQDEVFEPDILDETILFDLQELCAICNVQPELIIEMVEHGLLEPQNGITPTEWHFTRIAIQRSRSALRLQRDLELNWAGAALVLDLLEELQQLRTQLKIKTIF